MCFHVVKLLGCGRYKLIATNLTFDAALDYDTGGDERIYPISPKVLEQFKKWGEEVK